MDDVAAHTVFHSRSSSAGSGASGTGVLLSVAHLTAGSPSSSVASSVEESNDCCDGTHSAAKHVIVSAKEVNKSAATMFGQKELEGMECSAENFERLRSELAVATESLLVKEKEIFNLSRIRENVEAELEELTASLFEEAHKMVREANVKQASAERVLIEANMKIEGLETEVAALKTLVLTSTPAHPNVHLHPHIDPKRRGHSKDSQSPKSLSPATSPAKGHTLLMKKPSSSNGLENGSAQVANGGLSHHALAAAAAELSEEQEVKHFDPVLRKEYLSWHKSPTLDCSHPFLARIYGEDINPCLDFANATLAAAVRDAIHGNALSIVPVKDFSNLPRNCALLDSPVLCRYLVRLSSDASAEDDGFFISQLSRNRITAVCDCVNYLRYIQQGLVKSHVNDVYWEIMNLRRKMSLARFGFSPE